MSDNINRKLKTIKTKDMKVADAIRSPYDLGSKALNKHFSSFGGIVPAQSIFLTAPSGTGKTTFALHIAKCVDTYVREYKIKHDITEDIEAFDDKSYRNLGPPIFISLEMSSFQIKLYEERLGDLGDIDVIPDDVQGSYSDWLEYIIAEKKPSLVIIDSLQYAADIAVSIEGATAKFHEKQIVSAFKNYAHSLYVPVIVIGHTNKDGTYKGNTSLKHALDFHLTMEINESGEKFICSEKNRFGTIDSTLLYNDHNGILITDTDIEETPLIDILNINEILPAYHNTQWNTPNYFDTKFIKSFFSSLLIPLKDKYIKEIENISGFGDDFTIDDIHVTYSNRIEIISNPKSKAIEVGFDFIKKFNTISDDEIFNSNEINFVNNLCKTPKDKLLWIFLRELQYLIDDRRINTFEFYQKVANKYNENSYLHSENL